MQNLPFDWSHTHSKKGALASKWSTIFHTTIFGRGTKLTTILRFLDKFISSSKIFEKPNMFGRSWAFNKFDQSKNVYNYMMISITFSLLFQLVKRKFQIQSFFGLFGTVSQHAFFAFFKCSTLYEKETLEIKFCFFCFSLLQLLELYAKQIRRLKLLG